MRQKSHKAIQAILILSLLLTTAPSSTESLNQSLNFHFGDSGCGTCGWFVVVDGVMGGRSTGLFKSTPESAKLIGSISLANNGGFSSIRTPYGKLDLTGYKEVVIRYRSNEQDFALTLSKYRQFWRPRYKVNLPVTKGRWLEKTIAFSEFENARFDEVVGPGPSTNDLATIIRLGLISNTKRESNFELELGHIRFK